MKRYLKKVRKIFSTSWRLKNNTKGCRKVYESWRLERILYKTSQRLHLNCSVVRSETARNGPGVRTLNRNETSKAQNSRKAINVTKMPMTTRYMIPYLMIYNMVLLNNISIGYQQRNLTIQRRCLFCLIEYKGARICFDGRSQTVWVVSSQKVKARNKKTHIVELRESDRNKV